MLSLLRWTGNMKEKVKTKPRKQAATTTTNNQKNNDNIGKTNGSGQQQEPMRATTHNGNDDNDERNPGADKTEVKRNNNNNKIKGLRFLTFLSQRQKKKPEAMQEEEGEEGGGGRKRDKDKHDSRVENDGSSSWEGKGRGLKWWRTNKKKGSAAHNSRDTTFTTTTAATSAYAYAKHQQQQQQDGMPRNEDGDVSTNLKKSNTAREVGATGTRAAEENSDARALTPVYRFRTLDVFPRSFRHPLSDHRYVDPSTTPTLPRTAAAASSSSVSSLASSYNAKADNNNNNALEATTTTTTTTRPRDYYHQHRLRRVLSVEFIHNIEADTIDVPWSSSSPPSPLLTQSPLSQQSLSNEHEHEIEIEIEHEPGLQEQHQYPYDLTVASALPAHVPPIPLRPVLTHRPPYEPNQIQIHHDLVVHYHQGLSILGDVEDDATIILEREGPTVQDGDEDDDDVSVTLDVARATAKTEIDALWTTTNSCSSSSSCLSLSLTTMKTSTPNLDRVPLPFLPLPVPVKFVSAAQGPRRGLEPSDQSAVSLTKVHQAAPISGTEGGGGITSNTEKEREEGEGEGVCLFSSLPAPAVSSQDERRENIFSRRFICDGQDQPPSLLQSSLGSTLSHAPTCRPQQQQQDYLDQGHRQDPSGLIICHTHINHNGIDHDNSLNNSHGDLQPYQHPQQSRLWSVLPYDLEVEAALDECLSDIYHFSSSAPNSVASSRHNNRYSTITTSQDDNKSAYQVFMDQAQGWDAHLDYDRHSPPLPTPPLLKDAVVTTTVTTAFADAILEQDKLASSPQQLYQQLVSTSAPHTGSPLLPERSSSSDEGPTRSLMIAPALPPPVAILVLDQKDDICAQVIEDLDSIDPPRALLPGQQHQDGIEHQKQQEPVIKRVNTTDIVVDKSFLNGLFAGTLTWWTKPTPTPAPVPPITITTSAMAFTTSPILRRMNQGRGRPAQSGDLVDMDPFWDF